MPPNPDVVDSTTLLGKVICGYQGWFRAQGDPNPGFWVHWSKDQTQVAPSTLTVDMWPDMSEYASSDKYAASSMLHADGRQAYLFSSVQPSTVDLHFKWMKDNGIDGVQLQRFAVALIWGGWQYSSQYQVLQNVRASANKYGRVFYIAYDLAQMPDDQAYAAITNDWKALVDSGITSES